MIRLGSVVFLTVLLSSEALFAAEGALFCSKMQASGNPEYPPYLWQDPDEPSRLIGASEMIMQQIGERLGLEIELLYRGPWSRVQQEVKVGRTDMIAGAFLTKPRLQYMDYISPAFLTTSSVVWANKSRPFKYQRREDLIDLRGVTVIHNSFGQDFDQFAEDNLVINTVASLEQGFKMLSLGRVDYLLYEKNPAQAYAVKWGVLNGAEALAPVISSEGLYLTLSHKSSCNNGSLRGRLTEIVADLVQDGSVDVALEKGMALWRKQAQKE